MKFGLSSEQYNEVLNLVVNPLEDLGAKVWCFGSRARGDFKTYSDLDIMVETDMDLSAEISEIKETMTQSNFPYKVDIVTLSEFASTYKDQYEREKKSFRVI